MGFWVLAQVYGGNEGWVFIEDSSYSVLVETLLEKTNAPQDQKVKFDFFWLYATQVFIFPPSYALISFIVTCNLDYSSLRIVISFKLDILNVKKKERQKEQNEI